MIEYQNYEKVIQEACEVVGRVKLPPLNNITSWSELSEHSALEGAYEILETMDREQAMEDGRMAELEEEWGDRADEILTEGYNGQVFELPVEEAAEVIEMDKYASKYIDIEVQEYNY